MSGGGSLRVSGFSLIELLIVISIVGLINVIMFPNFVAIQNSAKSMSAKSTARNLMIALEQYYFLKNDYPSGSNVPISLIIQELNSNNLLQSKPPNPFTGEFYSSSDNSGRVLYSKLSTGGYKIVGYGVNNQSIIFEY